MNCGEKISWQRKKNNMTQAQLGDALNVTYQAVSKWERGESLPDFDTISKISKLFRVPISYFEDGGEMTVDSEIASASTSAAPADIIGMCVQCGKVVRDGDAAETSPKLLCRTCDEANRQAQQLNAMLEQQEKAAAVKRKKDSIEGEKKRLKRRRKLASLIAIIPAVVMIVIFLAVSLQPQNKSLFALIFGCGCVLAVFAYTFTAQMIWGGTVREICTGGGHVISLPGIIFSLSPDGLIFLIFAKLFLTLVAGIVFVVSIFACAFAAIFISPIAFIPSLLLYNRNIRKVGTNQI